jgi:hypothetical protein
VTVVSATASIQGTAVRDSTSSMLDASFGDGVAVASADAQGPARLLVGAALITGSQRAGLTVFGASVELSGTRLDCNVIHLDGELNAGLSFDLRDLGGNHCGCGAEPAECRVASSSLAPPLAL